MPKKYEYFIVLTKSSGVYHASFHITKILDHPINSADIAHFEKTDRGLEVTNYILQNVTGTFTYRVLASFNTPIGGFFLRSYPWTLDHRITAATVEEDYEKIKTYIDHVRNSLGIHGETGILFHQEIPDE
jgi:hypothetical protein